MTHLTDYGDRFDVYEHEREESRDAARGMTEIERAQACEHDYRPNRRGGGTCACGDEVYRDEL